MSLKILSERELCRFALPRDEIVVVRLVDYDPHGLRLDVRKHYVKEGAELPKSKGLAIRGERIPALRAALDSYQAALNALETPS